MSQSNQNNEKNELSLGKNGGNGDKFITLIFIVNGKEVLTDRVNINNPLIGDVEQALTKSGNTARKLTDWQIKYDDQDLDINAKIITLNLPDGAKIFISLKTAEGGNK